MATQPARSSKSATVTVRRWQASPSCCRRGSRRPTARQCSLASTLPTSSPRSSFAAQDRRHGRSAHISTQVNWLGSPGSRPPCTVVPSGFRTTESRVQTRLTTSRAVVSTVGSSKATDPHPSGLSQKHGSASVFDSGMQRNLSIVSDNCFGAALPTSTDQLSFTQVPGGGFGSAFSSSAPPMLIVTVASPLFRSVMSLLPTAAWRPGWPDARGSLPPSSHQQASTSCRSIRSLHPRSRRDAC
jgi:hypothetical protein